MHVMFFFFFCCNLDKFAITVKTINLDSKKIIYKFSLEMSVSTVPREEILSDSSSER